MVDAESLYEAHASAYLAFTGEELPRWDELSYEDQFSWQFDADELNESRLGVPQHAKS